MPRPFVLRLSGPLCVGKSTLEHALAEKLPGMYSIVYDRMKTDLSQYDRAKDGPLVDDLAMGLLEVVCQKQVPILLDFSFMYKADRRPDFSFKTEDDYLHCRTVAEQHGYAFIDIELTAPLDVLIERFHKRIADAKTTGTETLLMTEQEFIDRAKRKLYFPEGTPVFDTSAMPLEDTVKEILEKILPSRL